MKTKKLLYLISIVLIFSFILSGCGGENEAENGGKQKSASAPNKFDTNVFAVPLKYTVSAENGAYIIEDSEPLGGKGTSVIEINGKESRYSLIKFIDNETLKKVALCNKPGCPHSDSSCNAYLPSYLSVKTDGGAARFPIMNSSGFMLYYGEKLYIADAFGDIISMNPDGTEHRTILTLNSKYTIKNAFFYRGSIYFRSDYIPDYDENREQLFTDEDNFIALLKVDLNNETYEELFSFKNELETELLGLYDNKAYFFYKSPNKMISAATQEAVDNEENSHDVCLFACDLSSGERTNIKSDIKSYEFDSPTLNENYIYYQNRTTSELQKMSLDTLKTETVLTGFDGYIEYFPNGTFYDGKLFFVKNNALANALSDILKPDETFYIDTSNKELKKAEYSYKIESEYTNTLRSFYAVTSDYYIFIFEGKTVALKKSDFYNNSQNFVEV